MGFEEFLPAGEDEEINEDIVIKEKTDKIGHNQVYDLVTGKQADWQSMIYDLIHTEQLDPWDIDLIVLTSRYFEKLKEIEEAEYYVSSRVLLAAAFLLRIKSEFLLNKHIKGIDEILFGKKEEKSNVAERIEIDEDELPILIPKTPLPRQKKVTLNELMSALNQAINTESRRIKKEVAVKRAKKLSEVDFPKFKRIDLKDRIKQFYAKVLTSLKKPKTPARVLNKVGFKDLIGSEKEERLACFLPLLHLNNTKKLWLEQEEHLDEIWIYLYKYFQDNPNKFSEELEEDLEGEINSEFEDSESAIGEEDIVELAGEDRKRELELRKLAKEVAMLFEDVINEEEIEEVSGFADELE